MQSINILTSFAGVTHLRWHHLLLHLKPFTIVCFILISSIFFRMSRWLIQIYSQNDIILGIELLENLYYLLATLHQEVFLGGKMIVVQREPDRLALSLMYAEQVIGEFIISFLFILISLNFIFMFLFMIVANGLKDYPLEIPFFFCVFTFLGADAQEKQQIKMSNQFCLDPIICAMIDVY
ncbi:hypothetical protein ACJX0J_033152 [Zea mays]